MKQYLSMEIGVGRFHAGVGPQQMEQINMKREKTRMNSLLFDWNWKYQLLMDFNTDDVEINTVANMLMCVYMLCIHIHIFPASSH